MPATDDARNTIDAAIDALRTRRAATSDQAEKDAINDQINHLEAQQDALDENDLAASAQAVADATAILHDSVKAAQVGPFDSHLLAMHNTITNLQSAQADMRRHRSGWRASILTPRRRHWQRRHRNRLVFLRSARDVISRPSPPNTRHVSTHALPSAAQAGTVQWCCDHVVKSKDVYTSVGADANIRVPWYFVGVIHGMEGGFNFERTCIMATRCRPAPFMCRLAVLPTEILPSAGRSARGTR